MPRWYRYEYDDIRLRRQKWSLVPYKYSPNVYKQEKFFRSLPFQVHEKFNLTVETPKPVVEERQQKKVKSTKAKK